MKLISIVATIIGVCIFAYWRFDIFIGFVIGMIVNAIFAISQFKNSTAGYRVDAVTNATKDFLTNKGNTSFLRNRYRYSLGVIIDELINSDSSNGNGLPLLIDEKDRWDRFNCYVRPVIEDINPSSYLGWLLIPFSFVFPNTRRLRCLTKLCRDIEKTVELLDAGFEYGCVKIDPHNEKINLIMSESNEGIIIDIQDSYKNLDIAWKNWLKLNPV